MIKDDPSIFRKCIGQVVAQNPRFGDIEDWGEPQFRLLSEEIQKRSGILISITTLKRCFGKRKYSENYNPQPETKNAFAQYLGFENWEAYCNPAPTDKAPKRPGNRALKLRQKKFYLPAGIIALAAVVFLIFPMKKGRPVKFVASSAIGTSAINPGFHFSLPDAGKRDTFFLDYGDGTFTQLAPTDSFMSHPYDAFGFYRARLLRGKTELASQGISIRSANWVKGLSVEREGFRRILDAPLPNDDGTLPYMLQSEANELAKKERFWVRYRYIRDFGVDGDHFAVAADVVNNMKTGGFPYYDVIMKLYGETGNIEVFFIDKGMFYWNINHFSEITQSGKTTDLSAFVRNFSDWHRIGLKVVNKHVEVFFDGSKIYAITYQKPVGEIMGIEMSFRGYGFFRNYELLDAAGKCIYTDKHGNCE